MKKDQIGAAIIIVTIVLMQFIDLTIISVGEFVISFQKLCCLFFFPFSLFLIGRLRIKAIFVIFAVLMVLVNSSSYWARGDFLDPRSLSANATVFASLIGAVALYTALTVHSRGISLLVYAWIIMGCLSSILTVTQAVGYAPLFLVPGDALHMREVSAAGLMRGTGLKYDPNFQAMIVAIGLVFAQLLRASVRWPVTGIMLIGIIFTFSRMAFLVSLAGMLLMPVIRDHIRGHLGVSHLFRTFSITVLSATAIGMFILVAPSTFRNYLGERIRDAIVAVKDIRSYSHVRDIGHPSSAQARILEAKGAWMIFRENPLLGIGAYRSQEAINEKAGILNVAHNSYLELLVTGGMFGLGALVILLTGVIGSLRSFRMARRVKCIPKMTWNSEVVIGILCAFLLFFCFLSLNNNFVFWLPLVLAGAHKRIVENEYQAVLRALAQEKSDKK